MFRFLEGLAFVFKFFKVLFIVSIILAVIAAVVISVLVATGVIVIGVP